jgi:hypothetical protein
LLVAFVAGRDTFLFTRSEQFRPRRKKESTMTTKQITFENGSPFITLSWPATQEGPAGSKKVAVLVDGGLPASDDLALEMRLGGKHWVTCFGQKICDARLAD